MHNQRHLFLDDDVIEQINGLKRVVNQPTKHPQSPVLQGARPWEQRVMLNDMLYDPNERVFKMWYSSILSATPQKDTYEIGGRQVKFGGPEQGCLILLAYATSTDGIHWQRPSLGQLEFEGSRENNLLDAKDGVANFIGQGYRVFVDEKEADPFRRYKMTLWARREPDEIHLLLSPDGVVWTEYEGNPLFRGGAYDSELKPVWDPQSERYLAYARWGIGRLVALRASPDLLHWSEPEIVLAPDEEDQRLVSHVGHPVAGVQYYSMEVCRYEGLLLGFLSMFYIEQMPSGGTLDIQLTSSRDGLTWNRVGDRQIFIPMSPTEKHIRTPVALIPRDDTLFLYYSSSPHWHGPVEGVDPVDVARQWGIHLVTLRRDGFVSLDAGAREGTLLTKPLTVPKRQLHLNADASNGQVRVQVTDEAKKPLSGFERSEPIKGDNLNAVVEFPGADITSLAGSKVRLRFHAREAKLFSFWFE